MTVKRETVSEKPVAKEAIVSREAIDAPTFVVHETVEVYTHIHRKWLLATVMCILEDGGVLVQFKDEY